MTPVDLIDRGVQMFARYAEAPNRLGYCGPAESTPLVSGSRAAVEKAARQFTGAWPYLQVLSRMTGIPDPLDHRLVESYWLGGGLGALLDTSTFTDELLAIVAPQAGHYWAHLTEELVDEAAPNHCFHVFGVYPWSRLLGRHLPAGEDNTPLRILDSCRIAWGTVLSTDGVTAVVEGARLRLDGATLSLSEPETRRVELMPESSGGVTPEPGDTVAVHWDRVCDRLTREQLAALQDSTDHQLAVTSRRLRAQTP